MNPLETLKENYWINVYYSDNPKAPICTLEFVNKNNSEERYKHPVWRDKEKPNKGYIGKLDITEVSSGEATHSVAKSNGFQAQDLYNDELPPF